MPSPLVLSILALPISLAYPPQGLVRGQDGEPHGRTGAGS